MFLGERTQPRFWFRKSKGANLQNKKTSFTLTLKIWIANVNSKGLISKQGKGRGTYAQHEIAINFITWAFPKKKIWVNENDNK